MKRKKLRKIFREVRHTLWVITGAVGLTLTFFLVLPLMQTISKPLDEGLELVAMDTTDLEPPPPPPQEQEPEEEPEQEEPPPELQEDTQPLDLSQLELALNPGMGAGMMGGADFAVKINTAVNQSGSEQMDEVFSMADLDQKPRVVYQAAPRMTKKLRNFTPATVYIMFIIDENGRVTNARVQKSTDAQFDKEALDAVRKWRFEPGKRGGKPVRFRMRVPITFPKKQ